jgi:hypothetical protein
MNENTLMQQPSVCEVCGNFEALEFGDRRICADCYQNSGSCCAGTCDQVDG